MDRRGKSARPEYVVGGLPLSGPGWLVMALDGLGRQHAVRPGADRSPHADDEAAGTVAKARRWPGRFANPLGWLRRAVDRPFSKV